MIIEVPDLTGAECGDIAITAAEGGIGYWSTIVRGYAFSRWTEPDGTSRDVHDDFVFYTIRYENPDGVGMLRADITPDTIKRGVEIALRNRPLRKDLLDQLSERETWDEMDSELADCIVQLGVFGEVVFG